VRGAVLPGFAADRRTTIHLSVEIIVGYSRQEDIQRRTWLLDHGDHQFLSACD
jgi:hypothetical protein